MLSVTVTDLWVLDNNLLKLDVIGTEPQTRLPFLFFVVLIP